MLDMEPQVEPKRRTRLNPQARRAQLIACALEIFAKRGIGRAGHAEIAEIAQVSVATTFNYFNTRIDLVDAVLSEIEDFYIQMIDSAYQKDRDIYDCIRQHVDTFIDVAYTKPNYISIWLEWSSSVREEVWPRYETLLKRCLEKIEPVLEQNFDSGKYTSDLSVHDLARTLNGFGYLAAQMINHDEKTSKESITKLMFDYASTPLRRV